MTSRLESVTFKMASKVSIEFITEILSRFLGSGNFKIPIVIEKQTLVLFWDETSSGYLVFLGFLSVVEQFLRAITLTSHTFEGQYKAR